MLDDKLLILKFKLGDSEALRQIYLKYRQPLLKLAAEHDAYFMIQPYSDLKTGDGRFLPGRNGGVSDYLLSLRRRYGNFLSNPSFLARFDQSLGHGVPNCAAGRAFFNIDSTGDIAICVEQRGRPIANLYRHQHNQIKQRLHDGARLNGCYQCWYNCRGEVESLYNAVGLVRSLPTWLFDHGRPCAKQPGGDRAAGPGSGNPRGRP